MLGAAGFIIPEAFNKFGAVCGPEAVWFKVGPFLFSFFQLNMLRKHNFTDSIISNFGWNLLLDKHN
eukprot:Gb_14933 [translate_table: standard]